MAPTQGGQQSEFLTERPGIDNLPSQEITTMRTRVCIFGAALIVTSSMLYGQAVTHPWHVVDNGGGKSTSAGVTLQSSIGQPAIQAGGSGGINLEAGYIPGVRELSGTTTTLDFPAEESWNMVSVPLIV